VESTASRTEFKPFPKIARLSREMVVTEKIDGTSGCVFIGDKDLGEPELLVGSRTRWITPENDNHGFAAWAYEHKDELMKLGRGRHFGEWWGKGIQRNYGLDEKRFSLFNVIRWCLRDEEPQRIVTADPRQEKYQEPLPLCCGLVPILYRGMFYTSAVDLCLSVLNQGGSRAAPGFMDPEGVVVFHTAGNVMFKKTLGSDGAKGGGK